MTSTTLITGASLLDLDQGGWITGQQVLVQDRIIAAIAPDFPAREDIFTVDAGGKYLIPGLIEMHGHFYGRAGNVMRSQHYGYCPLYLSGGITSVRTPGEYEPWVTWQWKKDIELGRAIGPRIISGGSYFDPPQTIVKWFETAMDEDDLRMQFAERRGISDFYKVYSSMPPEWIRLICDLAHAEGKQVYGHLGMSSALQAISAGIDGLEHGFFTMSDFYSHPKPTVDSDSLMRLDMKGDQVKRVVAAIVEHDIAITPTVITFTLEGSAYTQWLDEIDAWQYLAPEALELNRKRREDWDAPSESLSRQKPLIEKQLEFIYLLHQAGTRLFCGTDPSYPMILPGAALVREAEMMSQAGLSNADLMRALTINAARELGLDAVTGSITPGTQADLVLLDADPLQSISNLNTVNTVWKAGQPYQPETLRGMATGKLA